MKEKRAKSSNYSAGATTLIAPGTHFIGDLHFSGNLEVEGKVTGNIIAKEGEKSRVRILQSGSVEGQIRVPELVVNGHIEGDLYVTQQLELASKAVVQGNVHYELIEIEKGAQVNGSFIRDALQCSQTDDAAGNESALHAVGV